MISRRTFLTLLPAPLVARVVPTPAPLTPTTWHHAVGVWTTGPTVTFDRCLTPNEVRRLMDLGPIGEQLRAEILSPFDDAT